MPPTDFTVLMLLLPMEYTLSMPQLLPTLSTLPLSTTLSTLLQLSTLSMPQLLLTQLLTPSTLPQLLPTLSTLPQLTTPQRRLDMWRSTPMRSPPTLTPTLLLMTTPRPPSTLRSSLMVPPTLLDLTPSLFPMAESNTSSTPAMDMMDMSLMSPTRVPLSTPRLQPHTRLPPPQLTTLKLKITFLPPDIRQDQPTIHNNSNNNSYTRLISRHSYLFLFIINN